MRKIVKEDLIVAISHICSSTDGYIISKDNLLYFNRFELVYKLVRAIPTFELINVLKLYEVFHRMVFAYHKMSIRLDTFLEMLKDIMNIECTYHIASAAIKDIYRHKTRGNFDSKIGGLYIVIYRSYPKLPPPEIDYFLPN